MIETLLDIKIPDQGYWREQIKCQAACPVHTDARGYIRAIADGQDELAYLIARGPNPLASICGRVCGAPCETACRRGDLDAPVAIRALKRYVCEKYGPESHPNGGKGLIAFLKEAAQRHGPRPCQGKEELLPFLQALTNNRIPKVKNKSIGIIGSGPAGLSAAHDLAILGFSVTLYEMEPVLGGMLAVGIPEYRLPRDLIRAEIEVITELGVKGITDCRVGKDITLDELRQRHDAVLIAVGMKNSRQIDMPGADADGVIGGVEFLRDVSLNQAEPLGSRVVVIGGGNVAYDVGRSVLRQISMDAARTARRTTGVGEVHLCSLESLEELPADDAEIIEGDEEGIIRHHSVGPKEILVDRNNSVCGVRFKRCLRVFDEQLRFNPLFDESELSEIACDNVLISIGQSLDLSFLDPQMDQLEMTHRGTIACDPKTGKTSADNIFVTGDLAYGPKLLIHAVASGKATARSIYERFTDLKITHKDVELHFPLAKYTREADYEKQPRLATQTLPVAERLQGQGRSVEICYTAEQARREAGRCLNCSVNTIFHGDRCILCGGCVDVCPMLCLRIVSVDRLGGGESVQNVLGGQLNDFPAQDASAIIKDETVCIRCALCAERCPVGAITMEQFCFKEIANDL
ncbi:MAG: FAD-dependent oxidoreductase [Planctomycetes bacterium]|nr:FAD-dependent oxidoreductase [Planctomycetota bacterium]